VRKLGFSTAALIALAIGPGTARAGEAVVADWVLKGGTVVDGTGEPGRTADVAIEGTRVVALGEFETAPGAKVVDASGLIVAPGFIDLHTHADDTIVKPEMRANLNYLMQGVTTVVVGNCGAGPLDVRAFLGSIDAHGAGTNVIALIPHGALRGRYLGNSDRRPGPGNLRSMTKRVAREMDAGAWGLSTGLIYVPSRYAEKAELVELCKVVADRGGFYASHIRDEEGKLLDAIDEAISIGREAGLPVHVSHLKASLRPNWGKVADACARIESARKAGQPVTADQYPYVASSTRLSAMVIPEWGRRGSAADFAAMAADPVKGVELRQAIQAELDARDGGAAVRIARDPTRPSHNGLDLVAIARKEGTTPLDVVLDIARRGDAQAIHFGMAEDDVRFVMKQPFVATASDGAGHVPNTGDRTHPRVYGTFPRKIRYALVEHVISLDEAIHAATGLPARILGLPDRGVLRVGAIADVVVFDPATFRDLATFDEPDRYATGVRLLFVNGVATIKNGKYQGKLAGRALRRHRDGPAELILACRRIWTGDPENMRAGAIAIRNGEIVAVGAAEDVLPYRGAKTRVIDRPKDFAMPGLIDAHVHLAELGATLDDVDLRGVASPEEVAKRVQERIAATGGDGWLIGRNWDQSLWPGGAFPTNAVLDAVAKDRPVWLRRVDGHAGWANSEALRRAKVTGDSKAPSDGQILRDSRGEPTGVFIDGAMSLVDRAIPPPSAEDHSRRILAGQRLALEAGLTGIHDAGVSATEAEAYRALDRAGKLRLRVYGMALPPGGGEVAFVSNAPERPRAGARFELRAIKLFIDGAMGSRGALLFEPYADDPKNSGLLLIDPKVLEATTIAALRHGWQVGTHAIGDKGNALVLDAYAAALKAVPAAKDPRLRVEHAQVVREGDVRRFQSLGIIASMQPSHASDDMRWADARLGPGRVAGAYAWRWFLDAGVPLAFGSDAPVEVINPFWGLYAAITRQDAAGHPDGGWHPDQRLTLDEALRAFTLGSARAAFAEDRVGVLKAGHRADLTVIDRDPFEVKPIDLLGSKVTSTVIDGEVVFGEGGAR
jgi:hypothetical protein